MKIYDFWAEWCGPCKLMNPIIDQIEKDNPDIEIVRVNVDEDEELVKQFSVASIPTYILTDESGNEIKRIIGATSKVKFLDSLGI